MRLAFGDGRLLAGALLGPIASAHFCVISCLVCLCSPAIAAASLEPAPSSLSVMPVVPCQHAGKGSSAFFVEHPASSHGLMGLLGL